MTKNIVDAFGVPPMSLQNRINGIESKDSAAQCQKILPEEECSISLKQQSGVFPTHHSML